MGSITTFSLFILGILVASTLPGAKAKTCPRDWLENHGNCYAYFNTPMTWSEAEIECQSYGRGTHLASVLSFAETAIVSHHIQAYQSSSNNVWIGLYDVRQNKRWRWADASPFNYKYWNDGQPDNFGRNEYCVELLWTSGFKKWNDASCNERKPYICKQPL